MRKLNDLSARAAAMPNCDTTFSPSGDSAVKRGAVAPKARRLDAVKSNSSSGADMHMHLGRFGPVEVVGTAGTGDGEADVANRCGPAGPTRPLEFAAFQDSPSPGRPPRVAEGSSEIVILDGGGKILVVNQAWRETIAAYGYAPPNAGIGASYVDVACGFLPDLDRAALELSVGRLLLGCVDEIQRTYAIRTADGLRWRHVQITPLSVGTAGRFVAVHDDLTELAVTQEALQVSSEQILTARDEERQRIAIELHDSTSQHLAAINLSLARLRRVSPPCGPGAAIIDDIAKSLGEAVKETRVISYLINPRAVGRKGLTESIAQFLEGFAQRSGLAFTLQADADIDRLGPDLQHAVLRIVQEALLNVDRHAQARRVCVELAVGDAQLTLSVADDGRGMPSGQGESRLGVGIPGMRARALQFSARLTISSDTSGTRVVAAFPLA